MATHAVTRRTAADSKIQNTIQNRTNCINTKYDDSYYKMQSVVLIVMCTVMKFLALFGKHQFGAGFRELLVQHTKTPQEIDTHHQV